ncbi:DUF3592 domain-containing protein [Flavobacterium sp. AC]|uniref:DUF3592 domain-containing protein n=1 Tax=Flavobacterium azizsancarii TaxID=2961580 RepID=A0ABT4WE64_9FLAO|nr:DUF3592 domain-containing protein [Flavobacterium azizsancarii]MDA6070879.1 DUF3592 domain-containing protein [Flavobacterium azizsancarii]
MNFENWEYDVITTVFICVLLPLFLYFSYWLFINGIIGLHRMEESTRWKYCIGEVKNAEIKYMQFSNDGDTDYQFTLKKTYKYVVNNIEYESNQTYASASLFEKEHKSLDQFPKIDEIFLKSKQFIQIEKEKEIQIGRKVTVYYDKNNPKKSCLINKINKQIYLPIFMGFFFGSGLTIFALKLIGSLTQ